MLSSATSVRKITLGAAGHGGREFYDDTNEEATMNKRSVLSAIAVTLLGSAAGLAAQAPQQPMSFFVATNPTGTGNLGGLDGADRICQNLAAAAGAGNKTWHAYLPTQARPGQPAVSARTRIGAGPWYNAK